MLYIQNIGTIAFYKKYIHNYIFHTKLLSTIRSNFSERILQDIRAHTIHLLRNKDRNIVSNIGYSNIQCSLAYIYHISPLYSYSNSCSNLEDIRSMRSR